MTILLSAQEWSIPPWDVLGVEPTWFERQQWIRRRVIFRNEAVKAKKS